MRTTVPVEQLLPSKTQLVRATLLSLVAAVVLLVTAVLPAEYGVDPLGVGGALGLDKLNAARGTVAAELLPVEVESGLDLPSLVRASSSVSHDTMTVVVPAYESVELKADMVAGQSLVFDWQTDGSAVYSDMHGEPPDPRNNEFTSYWKQQDQAAGRGMLLARFDGTHGWYWQNITEEPVTVTVSVSGFYPRIYEKR